jgi:sec-independent protein translocase protein TatA
MPSLGGWEFVILIGILVLLFGAKRLPDMARSIGQSARVFKGEMKGLKDDGADKGAAKGADAPAPPAAPQQPAAQIPPAAPVPQAETPAPPVQEPSRTGQGPAGTGL